MSRGRRWCSVIVVLLTTLMTGFTTACGDDPPDKEIQQAQQAIDTARAAEADRYAADEFTGATDALKRAQAAVVARDYRQALSDAIDARDRAQTAAKDGAEKKAAAKVEVDRALHNAALAIVDARATLRTAETSRRPARVVAPLRRWIAEAETHVQEARTAFERGDYQDAGLSLAKSMLILNEQKLLLLVR
jgi:hypothetical protein